MIDGLKTGLQTAIKKLIDKPFDEAAVIEFTKDIQRTLLEADVNVKLVFELTQKLQKRSMDEKLPPGLSRKDQMVNILYEELSIILGKDDANIDLDKDKCTILLLMGIQGSGKTTTAGKLAYHYKKKGYNVGVIGADTHRPGAAVQLQTLCDRVQVDFFTIDSEKDVLKITLGGIAQFKQNKKNIIIIDTAGRHKEESTLLKEMNNLWKNITPDFCFMVIDGGIGQEAIKQTQAFNDTASLGGIIITKLDGSAKGGGSIAAASSSNSKICFIGTGEGIDDLEMFSPSRFVGRLLGMGDLKALLERVKSFEGEDDEKKMKRITTGKMTIDDLYYQLEQMNKMGSLQKMLDLVPGFSGVSNKDIDSFEKNAVKWKNIIQSMTKHERENPEILNSTRIRRIARGSGSRESDVKNLLKSHKNAKQLFKSNRGRGLNQMMKKFNSAGM